MDVLRVFNSRRTPQSVPADDRQVPNSAGGYGFKLDDTARLRRFLTLGVDGGSYYTRDTDLAIDNVRVLQRLAASDPQTLVDTIVDVSVRGAAPKQNPVLFALAYAASVEGARELALAALPTVARTGTQLFGFAGYVGQFRGWGRGLRRAVGQWYTQKDADALAYQAVKYRQREGWSHRDLLRLAHPSTSVPELRDTFDWIVRGSLDEHTPALIRAFVTAQQTTDVATWASLVREHRLSWEMLPDAALVEPAVWDALLDAGLPQTALLRQLPRLTGLGLLPELSGRTAEVAAQLTDAERLRKSRVHPINVLIAQRSYASGRSVRGAGRWVPTGRIVDALDAAFYSAFGAITPAGKRTLVALDVSGSMSVPISGLPITARQAVVALGLVQLATEPDSAVVGFTGPQAGGRHGWGTGVTPLSISPRQRLDDVLAHVERLPMGATDCAQPMLYAKQHKLPVETFVIYTDNETWAGDIHPHQALRDYRQAMGIPARLVVVGLTATPFTIADPDDAGMLDIAGFDVAVPGLITEFARGL